MAQQQQQVQTKLFTYSVIERKDEIEEKYERCYVSLQSITNSLNDREYHDALTNHISKDKSQEEIVSLGLLTAILLEPKNADKIYRDLTLLSRDGLQSVIAHLQQFTLEKWSRLLDNPRKQLLWLVREMVRNNIAGVDNLCWNLMRNAAGGDVSPSNVALIEYFLDLYQDHRKWLERFPWLIASVVYSFLRFIEDHSNLIPLRNKEVAFTISLLRDRFTDCLVIGRDLVRLLQNVSKIPEFEALWKDLLYNPHSLSTSLTNGVIQILETRTSRRFLQSRLTPDMERKLVFFTSSVRFGHHKRYQEWFQNKYLNTPEAQSLRSDLIRFIVGLIHPTNELLCSDIIPRWAVIGWLITSCTSNIALANAKMALFYDWVCYDPKHDNIMNIEPAILVMLNSLRIHPTVTASLLDFLCRIIPNFYPAQSERIRNGIFVSLRQILDKRVLPSLVPLFTNPRLDGELRAMIQNNFREFCDPPAVEGAALKEDDMKDNICISLKEEMSGSENEDVTFSDEESESSPKKLIMIENNSLPIIKPSAKVKLKDKNSLPLDLDKEALQTLGKELRLETENLFFEKDNERKCEAMEKIVQLIVQDDEIYPDILAALGSCLSCLLKNQIEEKNFPSICNDDALEDSIGKPLFVMFRSLTQFSEDDSRRLQLLSVLAEMRTHQTRIGYLLLYYLQVISTININSDRKTNKCIKTNVYKEFCETQEIELNECLLSDLQLCQDDDFSMFCWLVPAVFNNFSKITIGNEEFLHLVVSTVDGAQIQEIICLILQGKLTMLRAESIPSLINCSLNWETIEQYFFWQLISAHDIDIKVILTNISKLDFNNHSEALTSILLILKREKPTLDILKPVLCREIKPLNDQFVVSVISSWYLEHGEVVANLVSELLISRCPIVSPTKRKRGQGQGLGSRGGVSPPTAERILGHMERIRSQGTCPVLFRAEGMQKALQIAQAACTDTQRMLFSNLFQLLEEDEPHVPSTINKNSTSGVGVKGRGRKAAPTFGNSTKRNAKSALKDRLSESSEDTSEEEEVIKPRQTKKRRKINTVASDSD
ncbi:integrator complex subunit 3-like isoform X3 [Daktulosphaira vitifoliae]|uniref:integrator complex subunit 3-like isoform X2 n=1 Tax=Daktulosphaira vitifoliae TaxID=58002 RepID=UPI0021AAE909|nr:integrator complex subunit 3-like isoform X2 [Daktulosphaira vitifoliae]XP_050547064.1 integrator complex subunit 3-like isoform X3 [Daktulosphaira vitifoliae]